MTEITISGNRTPDLTTSTVSAYQAANILKVAPCTLYSWINKTTKRPNGFPDPGYINGKVAFNKGEFQRFAEIYQNKEDKGKRLENTKTEQLQPKFTKKELEESLFKYLDRLTEEDSCFDDKDKAFLATIKKLLKGDCEFPSVMDAKASIEFMLVSILDYYKSDYQDTNSLLDVMTTVTNLIRKSGANK